MSDTTHSTQLLHVILDPNFGERLRQVSPGQPVWIPMSAFNEPVVRSLRADHVGPDHLTGITGFRFVEGIAAEDRFLAELGIIDLHHGPYSSSTPYTALAVTGAQLTANVRAALSERGFTDFAENAEGFTAHRSWEDAKRLTE